MPFISPEDGYLTVVNLFRTDTPQGLNRIVNEMRAIVDTAAFPGWVSSTVHRGGQQKLGTANFIQWRGMQDLESRYAGQEFKHNTIPVFREITTYVRLMQTEVEFAQRHPSLGDVTEISPDRDDYTVIEVIDVAPDNQGDLIATLAASHEWLVETPGYRSQSVLRGIRSRDLEPSAGGLVPVGTENDFVVVYSQWDSRESYDAFRATPAASQPAVRRKTGDKRDSLTKELNWNAYRVVHTRSAHQPATA